MKIERTGFTLIEIMIALAIIAIVACVALPAYTDHVIRAKLVEGCAGLTRIPLRLSSLQMLLAPRHPLRGE